MRACSLELPFERPWLPRYALDMSLALAAVSCIYLPAALRGDRQASLLVHWLLYFGCPLMYFTANQGSHTELL